MKCATHLDISATAYCQKCGKALCEKCKRDVAGAIYCERCISVRPGNVPLSAQPDTEEKKSETNSALVPEELVANVREGVSHLKSTLFLLACLIMFLSSGFGALASFDIIGTYYGTGPRVSIGQGIFCSVMCLVWAAGLVMAGRNVLKAIMSSSDGDKEKVGPRVFVKAMSAKWKLITASFAPVVAIYHFLHFWGLKATLPQLLALIGVLTTLSLGCAGMAYAFVRGCGRDCFSFSESVNEFMGMLAAIAAVLLLLYYFPARSFINDPGNNWTNLGLMLVGGFGLVIIFAGYFWLIWSPISRWLTSEKKT